jgi:DNA repair exonuclease SbcCD nuclease subunit
MSRVKFLHLADIHLGKKQYNIKQRYFDYFTAFRNVLGKGIEQKVDFVLISGDLIDSDEGVNPSMLREIINILNDFKSVSNEKLHREIPILCIEGNHENPLFSDLTWLKLLADLDLIILLSGTYDRDKNEIKFNEYSFTTHSGGKINLNGCNIYGLNYFGSATSDILPLLNNAISSEKNEFNILMMHFGIADYDQKKTGIKFSPALERLHKSIDYLALGHFHMQYVVPENHPWIFNPGSLEVNEVSETFNERGAFLIEVFDNKKIQVRRFLCIEGNTSEPLSIPNRRFMVLKDIIIEKIDSFHKAQEFIMEKLTKYGVPLKSNQILDNNNLDKPILYFAIRGIISYSQLEVDLSRLKNKIYEKFDILGLKLSNRLISSMDQEITFDRELSAEEIEKEIFLGTLELEKRFKPYKEQIFNIFQDIKLHLNGKKNYKKLKKQIGGWILSDERIFNQFLSEVQKRNGDIDIKARDTSSETNHEKEKFQQKKQIQKEEEPEFSEGDDTDLFEEGEIDDIIDDEDLDI